MIRVNSTTAKSVVEFGDSNHIKLAHTRPLYRNGAFFSSAVCVMAACAGRPLCLPVSSLAGSPTSRTLSPLFGDSGDSDHRHYKLEFTMSKDTQVTPASNVTYLPARQSRNSFQNRFRNVFDQLSPQDQADAAYQMYLYYQENANRANHTSIQYLPHGGANNE